MKPAPLSAGSTFIGSIRGLFFFFSLSASLNIFSQTPYPVTAVTTSTSNSTTSTVYSNIPAATGTLSSGLAYTYNFTFGKATQTTNNNVKLTGFVANGATFTYSGIAPAIYFRRVNINVASPANVITGKRVCLWFERVPTNTVTTGSGSGAGGTAALIPDYSDVMETLFATRTWNVGIDNVFQNAVTTNNNNIERVDVVFQAGLQATNINDVGFAVFDRGADGGNDPFLIAAIKTVDGGGNPTSYYPPVTVAKTDYGSGLGLSVPYHILRKEASDANLEIMNPNAAAQDRNGVFLTFSQLGIPIATTTFGYSIIPPDVNYTTAADLVTYTDAAHYPNNSDLNGGGLDMIAVAGVAYASSSSFLVVLPIQVDHFSAGRAGSSVQIDWQLDQTDDLKEVIVERSGNGTDFSSLMSFSSGFVGPQTCSDGQPLSGENYYRLKLVDKDGNIGAYSQVCAVSMNATAGNAMDIYPNPVRNKRFTIDTWGLTNNAIYQLCLFDMTDRMIFRQQLNGMPALSKNISLPGMIPAGVYSIVLTDQNGKRVIARTIMVE